jgi:hypothetical protein
MPAVHKIAALEERVVQQGIPVIANDNLVAGDPIWRPSSVVCKALHPTKDDYFVLKPKRRPAPPRPSGTTLSPEHVPARGLGLWWAR